MKLHVCLKPLSEDIKKGTLKAKDLIALLLSEGFASDKSFSEASLSDLSYNGQCVTYCKVDTWQMVAHINVN